MTSPQAVQPFEDLRCPRCGDTWQPSHRGRPRKWCSPSCRRAAYEERRAAANGAIAVEFVERITAIEHDLDECVTRVLDSPAASRRVLRKLGDPSVLRQLVREPRWAPVRDQALNLTRRILDQERPSWMRR